MFNPNAYYNNFLSNCSQNFSSITYPHSSKQMKIRKISSILDMKFFPTYSVQPDSFLSRAQSTISNTKKQIMVLLNWENHTEFISWTENVYETLRDLSGDLIGVLETRAVKCYENIMVIEQENEDIKGNKSFKYLKKILQQLVRFSIIYKEYLKRREMVKSETEIGIESDSEGSEIEENSQHSLEEIEECEEVIKINEDEIDEKLIKSIEVEVFKKQFYDLVLEYITSERLKLNEIKEICRICQKKVWIEEMTVHLESCQRKHYTLQELQLNKNKLLKLQKQIKQSSIETEGYLLMLQEIERVCSSSNSEMMMSEIFPVVYGNYEHVIQCSDEENDMTLVNEFKRLMDERNGLIFKLNGKELTLKSEISGFLGVDSVIKQNKRETEVTETEEKKQISCMFESSTISIQSNHARRTTKFRLDIINDKMSRFSKQPQKPILKPLLRSKKSVHWQQKAINTKKSLKNFQLLKFLGKGAFGKVYLVRDNLTHDYYAVKCIKMDKKLFQDQKNIQNLKNQHDIFRKISGQFLVKAAFSFSEGNMHMFFLEYMPGGDFAALLEQEVYLEQDVAKFYLAEIVLAIEHLHNMNIIHRDLKPANLVIDENGHLKLTDFGLSKQGITKKLLITKEQSSSEVKEESELESIDIQKKSSSKSSYSKRKTLVKRMDKESSNKSIVGTPDYIAPQVLNGISTENSSIDWWSFGVIVYETLIGVRPFGAMTIDKIYTNIRSMAIEWPPTGCDQGCISPQAKDLIESLLTINFSKRLGAETINQIKSHPFFQGITWQQLKTQKPPLSPKIKNESNLKEDMKLRKEIEEEMNEIQSTINLNHKIELDDYMRIDLLSQTTEKAFKEVKLKRTKVSCLYRKCVEKVQSMKDMPC